MRANRQPVAETHSQDVLLQALGGGGRQVKDGGRVPGRDQQVVLGAGMQGVPEDDGVREGTGATQEDSGRTHHQPVIRATG